MRSAYELALATQQYLPHTICRNDIENDWVGRLDDDRGFTYTFRRERNRITVSLSYSFTNNTGGVGYGVIKMTYDKTPYEIAKQIIKRLEPIALDAVEKLKQIKNEQEEKDRLLKHNEDMMLSASAHLYRLEGTYQVPGWLKLHNGSYLDIYGTVRVHDTECSFDISQVPLDLSVKILALLEEHYGSRELPAQ